MHKRLTRYLNYKLECLKEWRDSKRAMRELNDSEETIQKAIDLQESEIYHQEDLYQNFLRSNFMLLGIRKDNINCIAWYKTYLNIKLDSYFELESRRLSLMNESMPDNQDDFLKRYKEWNEADKQWDIMIEELERNINGLLTRSER